MEGVYAGLQPQPKPIIGYRVLDDGPPMPVFGEAPAAPAPDLDRLGDAIERARDIFSRVTTPMSTSRAPIYRSVASEQEEALTLMRGMRDDLSLLLTDKTGMWGATRAGRAQDEAEKLIATYSDPGRIARADYLPTRRGSLEPWHAGRTPHGRADVAPARHRP